MIPQKWKEKRKKRNKRPQESNKTVKNPLVSPLSRSDVITEI